MVFRKTANEYAKKNIGELQPYKEGTYIDLNNNVYYYDGLFVHIVKPIKNLKQKKAHALVSKPF